MVLHLFIGSMKLRPKTTIEQHFSAIEDKRVERTKRHLLIDIITITLCAVIAGAETWDDLELYGKCQYKWFKKFLKLPNGIPSHDTFNRVFAQLEPEQLQSCFLNWVKSISSLMPGEIVAIDGKTLRHSYAKSNDKSAIVMVSAWAQQNGLVLGQRKVDNKSNEITAIPQLLKVLYLKGAIVTIDAMGCQKEIVSQIVEKEADYVIALKKNQVGLYQRVDELFKEALLSQGVGYEYSEYIPEESGHGRTEIRRYQVLNNIQDLVDSRCEWKHLNSVACVQYYRTVKNGKTKLETRYFITSLSHEAQELSQSIRGHWSIENQLHWVLDVEFNEDSSRIRKDNTPENLAIIRHIALNLLKQDKTEKGSIRSKRNRAGWDNNYLLEILTNQ
jgi:predicted transposase YbfD/YdcC